MTLKPLAPYFFGGEYTFSADKERKEGSRYHAVSTRFPQQSAVLGMLRKTMLIQEGLMTMHKKGEWVDAKENDGWQRAKALCGTGAFSLDEPFDMGGIEQISPLFLYVGGKDYIPRALDADTTPTILEKGTMRLRDGRNARTMIFEGYDPKKPKEDMLISADGSLLAFDKVFKATESVGIKKSRDGEAKENAFFMKEGYLLDKEATFVFYAEFSQPLSWSKAAVELGADHSPFLLEAEEAKESFEEHFVATVEKKPLSRAVALSDILINESAEKAAVFILGNRISQRQIIRPKNKQGEGNNKYPVKKTRRYYLLERGSVLYTEDPQALENALAVKHLQRIGLNHFIITQGAN
jgi:CRISPR-associated protein Cmr3